MRSPRDDTANDWAYDLEESDDLSLVESAFEEVEQVGADYLDQHVACAALAACEVLARLRGKAGYSNAYTEKVDTWVAAHRITSAPALLARASAAIDHGAVSSCARAPAESFNWAAP